MSIARSRGRFLAAAVLFGLIVLVTADRTAAQPAPRKALTHADYDNWNKESGVTLSPNGDYVAYSMMPASGGGDGAVIVRQVASAKDIRIPRGGSGGGLAGAVASVTGSPQFNSNSTKVVFPLPPTKSEIDKAKTAKAKPEDMPRTVLAVMELPSGKISARLPYEKSFRVGGKGNGFLIYYKRPKVEPKDEGPARGPRGMRPPTGKRGGTAKAPPPRETPTYGSELVIRNLATGRERSIEDVADYSLTDDGKLLAYAVASKKEQTNGVYVTDPMSQSPGVAVKSGPGRYTRLVWDRKDEQLAFFFDGRPDPSNPQIAPPPRPKGWEPAAAPPAWRAYVWDRGADLAGAVTGAETEVRAATMAPAAEVVGPDAIGLREGWTISGNSLRFSDDGKRLFISTTPRRETARPASVPADERVELDVWHWKDHYVQPMQRVRGNTDRNRTYSGVVFLDKREFRQLSDEDLSVGEPAAGDWALGYDDSKYLHLTGYTYPVPRDYALVNVRTGERKTSLTNFTGNVSLSPSGKHLLVYDGKDWSSVSIPGGKKANLTAKLKVKFFDEEDDHPSKPPAYGSLGWSSDGDFALLYDRYDLWKLAADGSSAVNLTKVGRQKGIKFRYVRIRDDSDDDTRGIDLAKPMLLAAENLTTHDTGFFRLEPGGTPKLLLMGARRYGTPVKAKEADVFILTVQSFHEYPDYYVTGPDFHELKRVTDVNPHIRRYNWGQAELVQYKSADGVPLSGVLIKPENFDPSKKYPMVVYIYERLSGNLHSFRLPVAGTSINPTFYASNGYLVFMPDIAYTVGYPGQSALKCVLPAIQAVVDQGFVNESAIGIQGHSWGGYQIAFMVTQTNRFKAAIAGAPVSNMVSAYGGIRWTSGLPRQFQYEQTQSRIGDTLWNAPMRYIENSPIFMADRVKTPLLMLHNDQDGAVPWYQGIEYFLALRRLGRECYLLNYNGEDHGLRKKQNQLDYTVRMFQFFEHHLKGKPAPGWMKNGVPFVDRDKEKESIRNLLAAPKK